MVRSVRFLSMSLGVLALCLPQICLGANPPRPSTKVIGPLHIEQYGVYSAVGEISQKAVVPIGTDAILPEKEPTIVLEFPGGAVADLLNKFVQRAPDYGWEESDDGVIHVFRKGGRVSLLDVVLAYPGADKKTRREIWKDLANRPEISQWLKSNNCTRQEFFIGNEFSSNNQPISISVGSMTVRELFDETAIKSGSNRWFALQSAPSTPSCHVALMLW